MSSRSVVLALQHIDMPRNLRGLDRQNALENANGSAKELAIKLVKEHHRATERVRLAQRAAAGDANAAADLFDVDDPLQLLTETSLEQEKFERKLFFRLADLGIVRSVVIPCMMHFGDELLHEYMRLLAAMTQAPVPDLTTYQRQVDIAQRIKRTVANDHFLQWMVASIAPLAGQRVEAGGLSVSDHNVIERALILFENMLKHVSRENAEAIVGCMCRSQVFELLLVILEQNHSISEDLINEQEEEQQNEEEDEDDEVEKMLREEMNAATSSMPQDGEEQQPAAAAAAAAARTPSRRGAGEFAPGERLFGPMSTPRRSATTGAASHGDTDAAAGSAGTPQRRSSLFSPQRRQASSALSPHHQQQQQHSPRRSATSDPAHNRDSADMTLGLPVGQASPRRSMAEQLESLRSPQRKTPNRSSSNAQQSNAPGSSPRRGSSAFQQQQHQPQGKSPSAPVPPPQLLGSAPQQRSEMQLRQETQLVIVDGEVQEQQMPPFATGGSDNSIILEVDAIASADQQNRDRRSGSAATSLAGGASRDRSHSVAVQPAGGGMLMTPVGGDDGGATMTLASGSSTKNHSESTASDAEKHLALVEMALMENKLEDEKRRSTTTKSASVAESKNPHQQDEQLVSQQKDLVDDDEEEEDELLEVDDDDDDDEDGAEAIKKSNNNDDDDDDQQLQEQQRRTVQQREDLERLVRRWNLIILDIFSSAFQLAPAAAIASWNHPLLAQHRRSAAMEREIADRKNSRTVLRAESRRHQGALSSSGLVVRKVEGLASKIAPGLIPDNNAAAAGADADASSGGNRRTADENVMAAYDNTQAAFGVDDNDPALLSGVPGDRKKTAFVAVGSVTSVLGNSSEEQAAINVDRRKKMRFQKSMLLQPLVSVVTMPLTTQKQLAGQFRHFSEHGFSLLSNMVWHEIERCIDNVQSAVDEKKNDSGVDVLELINEAAAAQQQSTAKLGDTVNFFVLCTTLLRFSRTSLTLFLKAKERLETQQMQEFEQQQYAAAAASQQGNNDILLDENNNNNNPLAATPTRRGVTVTDSVAALDTQGLDDKFASELAELKRVASEESVVSMPIISELVTLTRVKRALTLLQQLTNKEMLRHGYNYMRIAEFLAEALRLLVHAIDGEIAEDHVQVKVAATAMGSQLAWDPETTATVLKVLKLLTEKGKPPGACIEPLLRLLHALFQLLDRISYDGVVKMPKKKQKNPRKKNKKKQQEEHQAAVGEEVVLEDDDEEDDPFAPTRPQQQQQQQQVDEEEQDAAIREDGEQPQHQQQQEDGGEQQCHLLAPDSVSTPSLQQEQSLQNEQPHSMLVVTETAGEESAVADEQQQQQQQEGQVQPEHAAAGEQSELQQQHQEDDEELTEEEMDRVIAAAANMPMEQESSSSDDDDDDDSDDSDVEEAAMYDANDADAPAAGQGHQRGGGADEERNVYVLDFLVQVTQPGPLSLFAAAFENWRTLAPDVAEAIMYFVGRMLGGEVPDLYKVFFNIMSLQHIVDIFLNGKELQPELHVCAMALLEKFFEVSDDEVRYRVVRSVLALDTFEYSLAEETSDDPLLQEARAHAHATFLADSNSRTAIRLRTKAKVKKTELRKAAAGGGAGAKKSAGKRRGRGGGGAKQNKKRGDGEEDNDDDDLLEDDDGGMFDDNDEDRADIFDDGLDESEHRVHKKKSKKSKKRDKKSKKKDKKKHRHHHHHHHHLLEDSTAAATGGGEQEEDPLMAGFNVTAATTGHFAQMAAQQQQQQQQVQPHQSQTQQQQQEQGASSPEAGALGGGGAADDGGAAFATSAADDAGDDAGGKSKLVRKLEKEARKERRRQEKKERKRERRAAKAAAAAAAPGNSQQQQQQELGQDDDGGVAAVEQSSPDVSDSDKENNDDQVTARPIDFSAQE